MKNIECFLFALLVLYSVWALLEVYNWWLLRKIKRKKEAEDFDKKFTYRENIDNGAILMSYTEPEEMKSFIHTQINKAKLEVLDQVVLEYRKFGAATKKCKNPVEGYDEMTTSQGAAYNRAVVDLEALKEKIRSDIK